MNLIAIIPSGQTEITVNGLHQWDYGQKLEIHSNELPAVIEVHFACSGMNEAVVRNCAVVDGVATADIPDHCIEQTTPIVAWVYAFGAEGTSGRTECTIIMPIIPRTKPAPGASVPTTISDRYTELVSAINEQVGALTEGRVTAAKALEANTAANANHATNASHATSADNANHATSADNANRAISAGSAATVDISLIASCPITDGTGVAPDDIKIGNMYFVIFQETGICNCGVFWYHEGYGDVFLSSLGEYTLGFVTGGEGRNLQLKKDGAYCGTGTLKFYKLGKEVATE